MNFNQWFESQNKCHKSLYGHSILDNDKWKMQEAWEACRNQILEILDNECGGSSDLHLLRLAERLAEKINNL